MCSSYTSPKAVWLSWIGVGLGFLQPGFDSGTRGFSVLTTWRAYTDTCVWGRTVAPMRCFNTSHDFAVEKRTSASPGAVRSRFVFDYFAVPELKTCTGVQRELMEQAWWGSPPWTWQDKGGRLDAQDGRGSACGLGRGSPHRRPADLS